MNENHKKLTEGPIITSLFSLAWPIIIASFLQVAYQLTDSFWVGRLGEKAIAAVAISVPLSFFLISLGTGFAIAGATLTAQYFGARQQKMVDHAGGQTLLAAITVAIILGSAGFILAPRMLSLMGAGSEILPAASSYLRLVFISLPINFCFFIFQSIMRSLGQPQISVKIIAVTVLLNFVFDPLFIFGFGAIPRFEVVGAAYATLATQSLAAIFGLWLLFSGKRGIKLSLSNLKPDWQFLKKTFALGLPTSIEQSARSLGMVTMTSIIAGFGTLAVASYGAGSNILQIVIISSLGLSAATAALIGQNIGAGKTERADEIARLSLKISLSALTIAGLLIFIFAPNLVSIFAPGEQTVIDGGSLFLRIIALSFGLIGIQMTVNSVMQASGNTSISMFLTIASQWLVQLPLAFILSRYTSLGKIGIWLAFPVTNIIMSLIAFLVFKNGSWKNKKLTEDRRLEGEISQNADQEDIIPYDA